MSLALAYFLSWLTITGGIYGLFNMAGEVLQDDKTKEISRWLLPKKSSKPSSKKPSPKWPNTFMSLFDQVFGEKRISWRFILLSILTSFFSLIVVLLGWLIIAPEQLDNAISTVRLPRLFLLLAVLNLIPDCLSLLESRWMIHWMSKVGSGVSIFALLVLDVVITFCIFVSFSWIAITLLGPDDLPNLYEFTMRSLRGFGFGDNIGIFVHTSFFTTVWVWLYVLSGFIVKLMVPLRTWLKIKQKPLQSMGVVLITLITLGYLIAGLVTLTGN